MEDKVGLLGFVFDFPFVKSLRRNNASSLSKCSLKRWFFRERFGSSIDHSIPNRGVFGPRRNEAPAIEIHPLSGYQSRYELSGRKIKTLTVILWSLNAQFLGDRFSRWRHKSSAHVEQISVGCFAKIGDVFSTRTFGLLLK